MGRIVQPLADTQRVVEWDELPPSVREIPENLNPLDEGVLMEHQAEWLRIDDSIPLAVSVKGRRTGITFSEAQGDTIKAASRRTAGGDNIYYIGDTRDKGLEFIGYCARFARVIAEAQGQGVSGIEQYIFEDQQPDGNTREITAYRIRFASGHQIAALSSRPANIRGLQGKVVIDEAAFHQDVDGVIEAATALLIWGGTIRVISTHNGRRNPFNQLINDIEDGRYGSEARVFRVTFDDAVANGLYERVCLVQGWTPTAEAKEKWYRRIRSAYGPRKAAMREELDAVPRDGGGTSIPGVWIENAMVEERPVLRLALDDDFAARPEGDRINWCEGWIERHLMPLLESLDKEREHVAGMDFARHRHFSVITPLMIKRNLARWAPFVLELYNVPTRQQEQILWTVLEHLPRWAGVAIDGTGPGQTIAEYTGDRFGVSRVHQINLSRVWYAENMPKMVQGFEDGMMDLPRDSDLESDLRCVEDVDGIPMVPKLETRDLKDADMIRHGDFAISLALAWYASRHKGAPIDWTPVPTKSSRWDPPAEDGGKRDNLLDDLPDMEHGAW